MVSYWSIHNDYNGTPITTYRMVSKNLIRTLTKHCEGCGKRIIIERGKEADYMEITRQTSEGKGTKKSIYYHTECAPLGNTSIPEKLGVEQ